MSLQHKEQSLDRKIGEEEGQRAQDSVRGERRRSSSHAAAGAAGAVRRARAGQRAGAGLRKLEARRRTEWGEQRWRAGRP